MDLLTPEEVEAVQLHGDKFSIEHIRHPEQALHYISGYSKLIQQQLTMHISLLTTPISSLTSSESTEHSPLGEVTSSLTSSPVHLRSPTLTKEQYFFLQIATVINPEFTLTVEQQRAFKAYEEERKCNC